MRLLILLLLPFAALSQNIIYHETCDGSTLFTTYVKKQTATTYAITQATDKYFNGTKSARFELRNTDPEVQSGTRAEITFPTTTNLNRWYSFAIYFPKDGYLKDNADEVINQWHQGGGKTPALCLRTRNDQLYLRVLGVWKSLGAITKDAWQSYVLHIKHSSGCQSCEYCSHCRNIAQGKPRNKKQDRRYNCHVDIADASIVHICVFHINCPRFKNYKSGRVNGNL